MELLADRICEIFVLWKPWWSNYELAIGRTKKEDPIRKETFFTVIGYEALDVFSAFMWDSDEDKAKMDKVLDHFEHYGEPRKKTVYESYWFFSRGQKSGVYW